MLLASVLSITPRATHLEGAICRPNGGQLHRRWPMAVTVASSLKPAQQGSHDFTINCASRMLRALSSLTFHFTALLSLGALGLSLQKLNVYNYTLHRKGVRHISKTASCSLQQRCLEKPAHATMRRTHRAHSYIKQNTG